MTTELFKQNEKIFHSCIGDRDNCDEIIQQVKRDEVFELAYTLNAKHNHKIMDYIPMTMSWGNDNPNYNVKSDNADRAVVMGVDNMPSYYIYCYYSDGDESVYGFTSPKRIKERGSMHTITSKHLKSIIKNIENRKGLPDNIKTHVLNYPEPKSRNGWGNTKVQNLVNHIVDLHKESRKLNDVSMNGHALGEILAVALKAQDNLPQHTFNLGLQKLQEIENCQQAIQEGVENKLKIFDKNIKVIGNLLGSNVFYEYTMKIFDADTEPKVDILSNIISTGDVTKLPSFEELSGVMSMWKLTVDDLIKEATTYGHREVHHGYFIDINSQDSLYSEDLQVIARQSETGYNNHKVSELLFLEE